MTRKTLYVFVAFGLLVVVVVGLGSGWRLSNERASLSVAAAVKDFPVPTLLVCYGQVDSRQGPLALQPARAGRVTHVLVKENQIVSPGSVLVQIDNRQAQLQLDEAELGVQAAQLQLAKAQDGLKQYRAKTGQMEAALEAARNKVLAAQSFLAAKEKLDKQGFLSDEEADVYRKQLAEAKAFEKVERHKQAELQAVNPDLEVRLAQCQLDRSLLLQKRARLDLEEYELKAPQAGRVLRVQVQEGDLVSPTSGKPALLLVSTGSLIVRAELSQEFAQRMRPGLPVQVEEDPIGKVLGKGSIATVSDWFLPRRQFIPEPTGINTGLSLECTVALDEGHDPLRLGQRVRVRVFAGK